jgi:hypothetical protein
MVLVVRFTEKKPCFHKDVVVDKNPTWEIVARSVVTFPFLHLVTPRQPNVAMQNPPFITFVVDVP